MPSRSGALAVMVLLAGILAGCAAEPALAGAVRQPPLAVGDVRLPDASRQGAPTTVTATDGELTLVYFGYTSCPDICPTTLSDISVALGDLPDDLAERVTVAMVTVDPERDTDERLTQYLGFFFDRSLGLRTADPEELARAASAFGVQYEVEEHDATDTTYDVAHTAVTYIVDDTGTVLVEWPFGLETDAMASDLEILLTRDDT
jgi:protein SCO1/2